MKKIYLDGQQHTGLTIMVFLEGTVLKPKSWLTLYKHKSYMPIGNAVEIINSWEQQGANIIYCTSRKRKQAEEIANILKKYGFTGSFMVVREAKEGYKDIVEMIRPDILIEDDCRSIGGAWQMCITHVKLEIKQSIKSIVIPEFKGIDHLSKDINQL